MKRKSITGVLVAASLAVLLLGGCGGNDNAGSTNTATDTVTQAEPESEDAGSTESVSKTEESEQDGLVGEWQYAYTFTHSEDTDGYNDDYVTIATDEYAPATGVVIRKDGDKYLADYRYQEFETGTMIYGGELKPLAESAYEQADRSWCMELENPFDEEKTETGWKKFSLTNDGKLVVSNVYISESDDNYVYRSISRDFFLPKGDPIFDDPENLRYFDTVTVSNAVQLLNSIQNNRKIIVEGGTYNFTDIVDGQVKNDRVQSLYGAYQVNNVSNLCIEAKEGADVQFCIDEPYEPVFSFEGGKNITIRGITAGHTVEPGYCSGSVLYFNSINGVDIEKCKLYGSGTYGIETFSTYSMNVTDTDIYECTYGLVSLQDSGSATFKNCTMRDSKDLSMIYANNIYDILFENCNFTNNTSNAYEGVYFVELGEYDRVTFKDCAFLNNKFNAFSNYEVTLENCSSDNNQAGFSGLINSSENGSTLGKDDLLTKYDETLARQAEIDERLKTDSLLDQVTLNQLAYEEYNIWDLLLNQIWGYIESNTDEESMDAIREDQKKWIREKEASMKEAGADFQDGSMQPMVEYSNGASLTQKRVEELLDQYVRN